jgi:hypothetical protein
MCFTGNFALSMMLEPAMLAIAPPLPAVIGALAPLLVVPGLVPARAPLVVPPAVS